MESNRRFLDVNQASLPLDHGTVFLVFSGPTRNRTRAPIRHGCLDWSLRLATPASSCWTMSPFGERRFARKHAPKDLNPDQLVWNQACCHSTRGVCCFSGSRETRTHKPRSRPPVFKTGPSSSRMTSVVVSCGSWNRTNGLLVQSQASLPTATTPHRSCFNDKITCAWFASSCGGRNRTCGLLVQSQASLPTATTPHRKECPAGVEPASPGWKPGTSAARPRAHG